MKTGPSLYAWQSLWPSMMSASYWTSDFSFKIDIILLHIERIYTHFGSLETNIYTILHIFFFTLLLTKNNLKSRNREWVTEMKEAKKSANIIIIYVKCKCYYVFLSDILFVPSLTSSIWSMSVHLIFDPWMR